MFIYCCYVPPLLLHTTCLPFPGNLGHLYPNVPASIIQTSAFQSIQNCIWALGEGGGTSDNTGSYGFPANQNYLNWPRVTLGALVTVARPKLSVFSCLNVIQVQHSHGRILSPHSSFFFSGSLGLRPNIRKAV